MRGRFSTKIFVLKSERLFKGRIEKNCELRRITMVSREKKTREYNIRQTRQNRYKLTTLSAIKKQQTCFSVSKVCKDSLKDVTSFSIAFLSSVSAFTLCCIVLLSLSADDTVSSKLETLWSRSLFSWVTFSNLLFNSCNANKNHQKQNANGSTLDQRL